MTEKRSTSATTIPSMGKAAVAIAIALLLFGCSRSPPSGSTETSFRTSDGFVLEGRLFGTGTKGVVLAHMRPADQSSWFGFAQSLSEKGYRVLTFNFRGYGSSEGQKDLGVIDRDVQAAAKHLMSKGAGSVVLVGASMGGTAAWVAASRAQFAGVVLLSAPSKIDGLDAGAVAGQVASPKLIVAANGDKEAAEAAELLYRASQDPRELKLLPGADHGTDLLSGAMKEEVTSLIEKFLSESLSG